MASNDLIIDDEYCKSMGSYFAKQGEEMDDLIVEYIKILQEVKAKAITSGDVSKALSTYIGYVQKLNKQVGNISNSIKTQVNSFLARVDSEDQYLF